MKSFKVVGFTLIETMVVVTIIIILSGIGTVGYFQFTQRQAVQDDARNFETELRKVQSMAKNLVYPVGCNNLTGYELVADCNGSNCSDTATTYAICNGNRVTVSAKQQILRNSTFMQGVDVTFKAGTGEISPIGSYDIQSTKAKYKVSVVTDSNGLINTVQSEVTPTK